MREVSFASFTNCAYYRSLHCVFVLQAKMEEDHKDLEARVAEEEHWHLNSDVKLAKVMVSHTLESL